MYFNGLVIYAFYNNKLTPLDPSINSTLSSVTTVVDGGDPIRYEPNYSTADQILMYFVSSQFGSIPGIQGVFVACLFAGALSSISSGLNAVAACILQDVVKPWREWRGTATVNDARDTTISKVMNCVFGVLATLVGFLVPYLGSFVTIANILSGVFGGPILSVFVMGMFLPRTNAWGTFIGLLTGFGFGVFISAGPIVAEQLSLEVLPIQKTNESRRKCSFTRRP
ncbi:sodium-dependent multivitamin transporter-like isoform X3 [Ptychodera flava]|uniref:sodium-dependent multivitamin transporter-like isoform X3 n=1 Tax=Ptychodera flava TaxID=63121 RepID=UPI00396AB05D